jgi:hypothetical protein
MVRDERLKDDAAGIKIIFRYFNKIEFRQKHNLIVKGELLKDYIFISNT